MISIVLDVVDAALLLVGLTLMTISFYGVLRLHAPGLATGPEVIPVLASSIATENTAIITFAVLAIAFVVLTAPDSGHAIARAAHRRDVTNE